MAPLGIVGYFAGNIALAGQQAGRFMLALVVPHAVFEIPASILAGAAILRLGMVMLSPPENMSLGESWMFALGEWARLMVGFVIPLLLAAAAVEVFVTPLIAVKLLSF